MVDIDQDYIKSILSYDAETGVFTWLPRPPESFKGIKGYKVFTKRDCGKPAGSLRKDGYVGIKVKDKVRKAHRLAWLHFYGEWPSDQIDHINGNKSDNRICNLRSVDKLTNSRNLGVYENNSSGIVGVHWESGANSWCASIRIQGKLKRLGNFKDISCAADARRLAEIKYGFHENHGKRNAGIVNHI